VLFLDLLKNGVELWLQISLFSMIAATVAKHSAVDKSPNAKKII
jgi:hypothetical protein